MARGDCMTRRALTNAADRRTLLSYGAVILIAFANMPEMASAQAPQSLSHQMDPDEVMATKQGLGMQAPIAAPDTIPAGDTAADALPVPGIPFTAFGNTCDYSDDYDWICPFDTPGAPDVVYAITPATDINVNIELCQSYYDTKLIIYRNGTEREQFFACNDDMCEGPNFPFPNFPYLSQIRNLPFEAGETYYIVVDGYELFCGQYELRITDYNDPQTCAFTLPTTYMIEGEEQCADGYVDAFNGGCNMVPFAATDLACDDEGIAILGESGTFVTDFLPTRDTDWYRFTLTEQKAVTATITAEFESQIAIVASGGNASDCDGFVFQCGSAFADPCETAICEATLPPGTYYLFTAPRSYFDFVICGSEYLLTLTGHDCGATATESISWSDVKTFFR